MRNASVGVVGGLPRADASLEELVGGFDGRRILGNAADGSSYKV